jgi:hypothetical protein
VLRAIVIAVSATVASSCKLKEEIHFMDALVETLDTKLRTWKPETAAEVRERIAEVIELADDDALDVMRSRVREQEVLDILDEPSTR